MKNASQESAAAERASQNLTAPLTTIASQFDKTKYAPAERFAKRITKWKASCVAIDAVGYQAHSDRRPDRECPMQSFVSVRNVANSRTEKQCVYYYP